jgi:dTDP-4-dehydrorhamnose 3,5-epimerase
VELINTSIKDLNILEPRVFQDSRGSFVETWNYNTLKNLGIDEQFVQDNQSISSKGTLRGIHFQLKNPQGKLVRVVQGEVYDVAVDLRPNSPSFGQWVGEILSSENNKLLWVPAGFGHAFYTMSDSAIFTYKCTEYYDAQDQYALRWNDPDLGIQWPINSSSDVTLSEQDKTAPSFQELESILADLSGNAIKSVL